MTRHISSYLGLILLFVILTFMGVSGMDLYPLRTRFLGALAVPTWLIAIPFLHNIMTSGYSLLEDFVWILLSIAIGGLLFSPGFIYSFKKKIKFVWLQFALLSIYAISIFFGLHSFNNDSTFIDWKTAILIVRSGTVVSASQCHNLDIGIGTKYNITYLTKEPNIDEIYKIIELAPNKDSIQTGTE